MFSAEKIKALSIEVSTRMSAKRYEHTRSVEECAVALGEFFGITDISEIRAAALLHDVAKEIPLDVQIELLNSARVNLTRDDLESTGVIHSFTAPIIVKRDFPGFATENVLSAVEKHTVGAENMTLFDKIIFISDYVEFTRPYPSCREVRDFLFSGISELTYEERIERLDNACVMAIDFTIKSILKRSQTVNQKIYKTRCALLKKKM